MKKILAFFFSLVLLFSTCNFSVSAKSNSADANTNQYISLNDAKLLAKHTILSRISADKTCPWKNGVSIENTITMYDFDDLPNAYAFNLKQNSKNVGYILVDANANTPKVAQFAYDTEFYLDGVFDKNFKNNKQSKNVNKKYYFISPYDVLVQNTESNKQVFYDIFTKQKINADKSTIKSDYKQIKQNSKDNNSINLLNKIKSSSLNSPNLMNMNEESLSQSLSEIMEKADVPNCDAATFYTTNQFSGENNCGPTAGTTLVMYWNVQRGISSSSAPSLVFNQLYADMKTNAGHSGTYADDCYNGLLRYANEAGRPPLGSDFINTWGTGTMVSYETIRGNIVNGNPVLVATYAPHTKYGNHFVDIFGIEHNTSDYYLRIADGWTSSHQTWISYSELYPEVMLYLRW